MILLDLPSTLGIEPPLANGVTIKHTTFIEMAQGPSI